MKLVAICGALGLLLAGCMDIDQTASFSEDGALVIEVEARIKRQGWDMMPPDQRAEYLCGEPVTRNMPNGSMHASGETRSDIQLCSYRFTFPDPQDLPEDMPIYVDQEDGQLVITMGVLLEPKGEMNDVLRGIFAGASYVLRVNGDISATTATLAEDGRSTTRVISMVDAMGGDQRLGLRAWLAP
ncbi:MAG: hypothetical protein EA385_00620 [Salinarimonadaceae bacterium]|nr:MAG: hypothetical protein EA385_00620 [Salinarimonadaceae bacterium]